MEKTELHIVIKECLRNNKIHQKKLYMAYYGFGYGVALRYAASREEASIIMNQGFYNVFVGLRDYDETFEFKEWLKYHILLAAIKYLFDIKKSPVILHRLEISDIKHPPDNLGTGFSYDDKIEMLHHLHYRCRVVFNLFAIEGYEHEKIATMLNISVNDSKTLLIQARERLNHWMGLSID